MILSLDDFTIELIDDRTGYQPGSSDNAHHYDRVHAISDRPSSTHGIRVSRAGQPIASAIILAGGGASTIHAHSALLRLDILFLAAGPCIVKLAIPSLALLGSAVVDDATCFGLHPLPGSTDILSHGELSIARVTEAGSIIWSASGADIFTGELRVLPDEVRVTDFEGRPYAFDLLTGVFKPPRSP